jgi:hypothetical protein
LISSPSSETLEQEQASGAAAGMVWDAARSGGQDQASGDSAPKTTVNVPRRSNPAPILPWDKKYLVLTGKGRPVPGIVVGGRFCIWLSS